MQEVIFSKVHDSTRQPIKSVFEEEKEVQLKGLFKEMVFVAPPNHEVLHVSKLRSPRRKNKGGARPRKEAPVVRISLN
jgi:hypothetical protein